MGGRDEGLKQADPKFISEPKKQMMQGIKTLLQDPVIVRMLGTRGIHGLTNGLLGGGINYSQEEALANVGRKTLATEDDKAKPKERGANMSEVMIAIVEDKFRGNVFGENLDPILERLKDRGLIKKSDIPKVQEALKEADFQAHHRAVELGF